VGSNGGIDQFGAMALERGQRPDFVAAHQAAVADNVGGHDRAKSAFHR
jgi:hypothetical protein